MEYESLYKHEGLDPTNLESMAKNVTMLITRDLSDEFLVALVEAVMNKYGMAFCESVGSATKHHDYPGGLLDHTLEVLKLSKAIGECYPNRVNMELIIVGAFLHDLGKIISYEDKPNLKNGSRPRVRFQRSDEDKIMGHFGEALTMLEEIINGLEFDDTFIEEYIGIKRQLYHIIASHHGEARLNWGSITDPVTNEAHIVALADLISSRIR